jgi:hypothetical protein
MAALMSLAGDKIWSLRSEVYAYTFIVEKIPYLQRNFFGKNADIEEGLFNFSRRR